MLTNQIIPTTARAVPSAKARIVPKRFSHSLFIRTPRSNTVLWIQTDPPLEIYR